MSNIKQSSTFNSYTLSFNYWYQWSIVGVWFEMGKKEFLPPQIDKEGIGVYPKIPVS